MRQEIKNLTQSELFRKVGVICALVNRAMNGQELLDSSLKEVMDLFSARRGSLFIRDEKTKDLVLKSAVGLQWAEKEQLVKKMGQGIVGRVAETKTPIFVEDIKTDDRFKDFKPRSSYETHSFICAPLLLKDTLIGILNMSDKESGHPFDQHELQLVDFLATQIALNYRRIELYEKLRAVLKKSQDLREELGKTSEETSLLKRQILAHEKLATLGKLVGGIAHEFNNPLDGVMRYTNLCLQHVGEDDVMRGYLLEIKQGLNRMANIVRSLLACSRGEIREGAQKIDPNTAVIQAVDSVKIDAFQKNIKVEKILAAGLPKMDDFGLERIIENLLRNAVDAVDKKGKIVVATTQEDGNLILTVRDNGAGFVGVDDIAKIFEPFYTTKKSGRGCGLGLTIVSEVVKRYNGDIDVVANSPDQGIKFIVRLPIERGV